MLRTVQLLPLGSIDTEILGAAETAVARTFGFSVLRMAALPSPEYANDVMRRQYSSELILRSIIRTCPQDVWRLLAVTKEDLFIPMLTFVYGQAQLNGKVSVVSYARLKQNFYGLKENPFLTQLRIQKEAIHELGHTFGLTHCRSYGCPMSLSTDVDQLDNKGSALCSNCTVLFRDFASVLHDE